MWMADGWMKREVAQSEDHGVNRDQETPLIEALTLMSDVANSFDSSPCSSEPSQGEMREDWLPVSTETLVPAGPGAADRTGFRLWMQRLSIQGHDMTLVGPSNIDSVTFWYWRRGLREMDPFWARPWPSGLALADRILR